VADLQLPFHCFKNIKQSNVRRWQRRIVIVEAVLLVVASKIKKQSNVRRFQKIKLSNVRWRQSIVVLPEAVLLVVASKIKNNQM